LSDILIVALYPQSTETGKCKADTLRLKTIIQHYWLILFNAGSASQKQILELNQS